MKLIFENWRNYTASILNEDLLVESYQQAQESVVARASKWFKGYVYEHEKDIYDKIEEKIKTQAVGGWDLDFINDWGLDYDKAKFEIRQSGYVLHWDIAGYVLLFTFNQYFVPNDLTDKQKQIALLWSYKQFVSGNVLDKSSMYDFVFSLVSILFTKVKRPKKISNLLKVEDEIYDYYWRYFGGLTGELEDFATEEESIVRKNLIENFFQWNRFIRDGKRDLNAVADYNELYRLTNEARPLYMAWQEKQDTKDPQEEMLLNNKDWEIKILLNKSAARIFGKNSNLCTAAPGLNYFDTYSKPNDPLIAITNKKANKRYQFNFGKQDFKYLRPEEKDKKVCFEQTQIDEKELEEIMKVLVKVVPEKYNIAYNYLQGYYGE